MTKNNKKYVKIVILSTLAEPNSSINLSKEWFNNSGRLYQGPVLAEIKKAVASKLLIQEKKKYYRTDVAKFLDYETKMITLGGSSKLVKEYQNELKHFYLDLGEFTQKVYLNHEVIKVLTKLDLQKLVELNPALLIQLPFILRYLEIKDESFANLLVQIMGLEEYVELIYKLERKYHYLLEDNKQIEEWVRSFRILTKLLPKLQKKGLPLLQKNTKSILAFGGK